MKPKIQPKKIQPKKIRPSKRIQTAIRMQEWHLEQAKTRWEALSARLQTSPNQMNVYGIWAQEQIETMRSLHATIAIRTSVLAELRKDLGLTNG